MHLRIRCLGAEGRGKWEMLLNGHRDSMWDDEQVLDMDGSDGCTAV